MAEERPVSQLVVIGASAGGIDALSTLVGTLPRDFPAPIVVAQHLDPRRASHLEEIVARRGPLTVRTVQASEPLLPGVIYVVPANRVVEVSDHRVTVREDGQSGPKPSVDRLFDSAARAYGEGLVAVILSGSGSDGAAGARHVTSAGGTVIIQNPDTATFPSMPQSLAPTTVDIVADVEEIGPLLYELVSGEGTSRLPAEDKLLAAFLEDLREQSGIDFRNYKRPTIVRRLRRRMSATSSPTLADYVRYLGEHPEEYQRLVTTFLIKVTEFFRDRDLFDYLRTQAIPELIAEAGRNGNEIRLWSAGCATGEEAYSLALLVADALGDRAPTFSVRVFATDLDSGAIAFARRGVYPASVLSKVPEAMRERYFDRREGGEYEVRKALRLMMVFGEHDIGQRAPFPRIDMVVCRNVLIYFTTELQTRALQLFAFSVRDGGVLILGKAESTSALPEPFALEDSHLKVYRRRGPRVLIPPVTRPRRLAATTTEPGVSLRNRLSTAMGRPVSHAGIASDRAESVLQRLPVGVVAVNKSYDIEHINTAARRLLGIHAVAIGNDFVHLASAIDSAVLRRLLDRAFGGDASSATVSVGVGSPASDGARSVRLQCIPPSNDAREAAPNVLVLVEDISADVRAQEELKQAGEIGRSELERLKELVRSLGERNAELLHANQELAVANAELRAGNEDLLVSNEDVQAATEEVETLNEELQATNEELETLNEELQATVEELNTTTEDLESRSRELQQLAVGLEQQRGLAEIERLRLSAVLAHMADGVIVIGPSGEQELANEAYEAMLDGVDLDRDATDFGGQPLPSEQLPLRQAAAGEPFSIGLMITTGDGGRRWIEAIGAALGEPGSDKGSVVVVRDITDRNLRRLQEEFLAVASHELRTPLAALRGYLQLLSRSLPGHEDSETNRYTSAALLQSERLDRLVAELLDVTRLEHGRMQLEHERTDLVSVARRATEISQILADEQPIAFKAPRGELLVAGDPFRLEQALLNIIGNAIQHAPESPTIEVDVRRAGDRATVAIRDRGPGIPKEIQAYSFERFSGLADRRATPSAGLGLGLYISKAIVEAHGGRISLRSEPGSGTRVAISLPLATAEGTGTSASGRAGAPGRNGEQASPGNRGRRPSSAKEG
jgi:two-component system CheB/CheR fusion protein